MATSGVLNLRDSDKYSPCSGKAPTLSRDDEQPLTFNRINQVCDKGKGSVPRGRVYANYVSRCATERVTVLNPASFGKLVRVLFPGLKTRRLGVRGESKYHYVNFSLKEDLPDLSEANTSAAAQTFNNTSNFTQSFR